MPWVFGVEVYRKSTGVLALGKSSWKDLAPKAQVQPVHAMLTGLIEFTKPQRQLARRFLRVHRCVRNPEFAAVYATSALFLLVIKMRIELVFSFVPQLQKALPCVYANIGVATGPESFFVVDIDIKEDVNGQLFCCGSSPRSRAPIRSACGP
jgi:hypothetical protein